MNRINMQEYEALLNDLYLMGDHEWSSNSFYTNECEIASGNDIFTLIEDQSECIMNGFNYWDVYLYKNGSIEKYYQVIV